MAEAPPSVQENPYLPNTTPLVFDTFIGIDTSSSRPGIADEAMAWCDGFMPLGKNNLRTLPGVGDLFYDCGISGGIVCFGFANLGSSALCIVFLSDGSVQQVNRATQVVRQIAAPGVILNPSQTGVGISQWGSQYILIVAEQTNGYFIWDGTVFYTSGTLAPVVTVTDGGMNYTSQPTITVSGGSGSGATFRAQLGGGFIENIFVVNPGSGYVVGDTPILTISGGGSDSAASATATVITGGGVQSINVSAIGAQFGAGSYATISGPGGAGAQAVVVGQFSNGQCVGIQIINPGSGYTSPPAVAIFDPTGTGFGFAATAIISTGQIGSATITSGGSGYVTAPTVNIIGDGVGATISATIGAGMVTTLTVTNPGLGYTHAQLQFSGGNKSASATVDLMPFGVKGSAVETYQSRAWIVDGALLQFTAPESLGDFSTSSGGGFAPSTDSFLRIKYVKPIQTSGFLYLVADSSINYISGVQTSGVPATTTYTNQNADPEIGTPYPDAIDVFSRNIVFANPFGVHVSYGGAVAKTSEALDGVYNTVLDFGGFQPSSAKAIIFGKKVWMVLIPVVDPIGGQVVNKLFMTTGGKQWWSSQQDIPLTFITSQELNSVLTAWGTDGQRIYPLFRKPSAGFEKTVQSKLWATPGSYYTTKAASRFAGLAYYYSALGGTLDISIDNEDGGSDPYPVNGVPNPLTWINASGDPITWTGSHGVITWRGSAGTGVFIIDPFAVAQNGSLTGMTITTSAADMALISATIGADEIGYRL